MDVGALLIRAPAPAVEVDGDIDAPKPFGCMWDECGRSFARKSDLVRHFRIHTGVKPFKCPWPDCSKCFIQRSALKVHFRTHSGERPHTCEVCDRCFSDSSSLARHRRTHTGVRPYGCAHPGCSKRFTRKTSLRKHAQTHDPDYSRSRRRADRRGSSATYVASPGAASPALSPDSRQSTPGSASTAASPLLSVQYLVAPPMRSAEAKHCCDLDAAPMSPGGYSSSTSTAYGSPVMRGAEGAVRLPPISSLFH